jgi:tRNA threonylcarbamoyladenosine biosynthesis protein TsaE
MSVIFLSESLLQTREIGEKIGRLLHESVVIKLKGDMATGKTSLVQGLAKGLGVPAEYYITSPTFTLVNQYPGRLDLYHIDLYRLGDAVDFEDIGLFDILLEDGVAAVEWSEKLSEDFENEITIVLTASDDHSRKIHITARGDFSKSFLKTLEKHKQIR